MYLSIDIVSFEQIVFLYLRLAVSVGLNHSTSLFHALVTQRTWISLSKVEMH